MAKISLSFRSGVGCSESHHLLAERRAEEQVLTLILMIMLMMLMRTMMNMVLMINSNTMMTNMMLLNLKTGCRLKLPKIKYDDCDRYGGNGYDDLFDNYEMNRRWVEGTQLPMMMIVIQMVMIDMMIYYRRWVEATLNPTSPPTTDPGGEARARR